MGCCISKVMLLPDYSERVMSALRPTYSSGIYLTFQFSSSMNAISFS